MTDTPRQGRAIALGDQRILSAGRLRWLRAVAWMIACFLIVFLAFGAGMVATQSLLPKGDVRVDFLSHVVGAAFALGAYALLVRFGEARRPSEIAWRPAALQTLAGLGIGLAMFAAVMTILAGFGLYEIAYVGPQPAWRGAGLAVQSGVVEELAVRGVMLRLLWRAFGPIPAFLVSAAMFGAGHLANPNATLFAALCIALEAGIMLGAFYALTGRLWVSIGVHAAWNFAQGYLFGAAVSGTDFGPALARSVARPGLPEWLTGGPFGPEASLPALVVCTGVGVATLWQAWRTGAFARDGAPAPAGTATKAVPSEPSTAAQ